MAAHTIYNYNGKKRIMAGPSHEAAPRVRVTIDGERRYGDGYPTSQSLGLTPAAARSLASALTVEADRIDLAELAKQYSDQRILAVWHIDRDYPFDVSNRFHRDVYDAIVKAGR